MNFSVGLITLKDTSMHNLFTTQLSVVIEVVSTWPDADKYVQKLQRLQGKLIEKGAAFFEPDPNEINTLIHGDA